MNWSNYVKPLFFVSYILILCIVVPLTIMELYTHSASAFFASWFVAGLFVIGAIPISLWTISEHLINYTQPLLQRPIIRILWMVPIYAVDAWLALRFPDVAIYFDTLRECYEAYAIYNFLTFLLNYLRLEHRDLEALLEEKESVKHLAPFCCLQPWPKGRQFINICRHGTLQYTVIRPVVTAVALTCEVCGVYEEGNFSFRYAFLYLTIASNISQIWAMYCLVLFYQCTKTYLRPMNPISKFVCVKFVVFMSFWQSVLISILVASGIIAKVEAWKLYNVRTVSISLQNFAICIEMFFAAIAHHFSFNCAPYRVHDQSSTPGLCRSWWSMCDVSDMQRDLVEHVNHIGKSVKRFTIRSDNSTRSPYTRFDRDNSTCSQTDPIDTHSEEDVTVVDKRKLSSVSLVQTSTLNV